MKWSVIFALILTGGAVLAEPETPASLLFDYNNKHSGITQYLSDDPSHEGVSILGEVLQTFEEKCKALGHEDAYGKILAAKDEVQKCVKNLVNVEELEHGLDFSAIGGLDIISHTYCRKATELENCVGNFLTTLDPCLDEKQKEKKNVIVNVTVSLIDFVCYKGGDRITLFVAEGGTECVGSKSSEIKECVLDNIRKASKHEKDDSSSIISEQRCRDFRSLQVCIVDVLKTCSKSLSPAYIIENLFSTLYKKTPCNTILPAPTPDKPAFEEKCRKEGYDDSYKKALVAGGRVQECVGKVLHRLVLRTNVAKDYFAGDPRRLIGNYCSVHSELKECVTSYTSAIEPCLNDHDKKNLRFTEQILDALNKYGCD